VDKSCVGQQCGRTDVQTAVGPLSAAEDDAKICCRKHRQVDALILHTHSHFCSLFPGKKSNLYRFTENKNTARISPATYSLHHGVLKKKVLLQAWSGPEGSRKLRFPDFMTTAQEGGKVVSLTHRPPLPPGNDSGTIFR